MPTTIEDRLVVGDATVVADLYGQHGTFIHTISQQLVGAAADRLTQQIFVEAWRNRLDFDPSLGTVRNWLVRRARDRVSKPSAEADEAVDRLVVSDSLARMEETRGQVLAIGAAASDAEQIAADLDLPVATVKGHLRQGTEALRADLADSRSDAASDALADIMSRGQLEFDLNEPPTVVWNAVVAELRLAGFDVTADRPESDEQVAGDASSGQGYVSDEPSVGGELDDLSDVFPELGRDNADPVSDPRRDGMDELRADAVETQLDRPIWRNPVAIVVLLMILAMLIFVIF